MRWPFSKKHAELEIPPVESQRWTVAIAEMDDGPLLVRINDSARELAGHAGLPIKLGFAVPLNQPNPGGHPDPAENEALGAVEDLVAQRVFEATIGIHVLTLTNGVMKEFVFYIPAGVDIARLHEGLRADVTTHDLQCIAEQEPKWQSFRSFVP
jgi:hypothetical protein